MGFFGFYAVLTCSAGKTLTKVLSSALHVLCFVPYGNAFKTTI